MPLSTLVLKYPGVPWSTLKECATRARRSGRVCARSTFVLADGGGSPRQLCAKDSAGDAAAVHRRLLLGTPTAPAHSAPCSRTRACAQEALAEMHAHACAHTRTGARASVPHRALPASQQVGRCFRTCNSCSVQHAACNTPLSRMRIRAQIANVTLRNESSLIKRISPASLADCCGAAEYPRVP